MASNILQESKGYYQLGTTDINVLNCCCYHNQSEKKGKKKTYWLQLAQQINSKMSLLIGLLLSKCVCVCSDAPSKHGPTVCIY